MANSQYNLEQRLRYRKTGIYSITNLVNGKMYIGYASNFVDRKSQHFKALEKNCHKNTHLQSAYNKYGKKFFKFEILEECEERFLVALEHYWATILNTHNPKFGYNKAPTNPNSGMGIGYKKTQSPEARKRRKDNWVFTDAIKQACKESIKKAQAAIRAKGRTRQHSINHSIARYGKRVIEIYKKEDLEFLESCVLILDAVKITGVSSASIRNNLCGVSKSAGGFIFKYKKLD